MQNISDNTQGTDTGGNTTLVTYKALVSYNMTDSVLLQDAILRTQKAFAVLGIDLSDEDTRSIIEQTVDKILKR